VVVARLIAPENKGATLPKGKHAPAAAAPVTAAAASAPKAAANPPTKTRREK